MTPFVGLLGSPSPAVAERALALLVKQYTSVRTQDILDKRNLVDFVQTRDFLSRSTPLRKRVCETLDQTSFDLLKRADMPHCYVVYTNYHTGSLVVASPKDNGMTRERFIDAMMASASVPVRPNSSKAWKAVNG